nr:hypothetical protein [Candidatus Sigynarchaeota archaeon]
MKPEKEVAYPVEKDQVVKRDLTNSQAIPSNQSSIELRDRILQIANTYIDKHYIIDLSDLLFNCYKSIKNFDKNDINKEIDKMIKDKFFFNGKALTKPGVLINENRKEFFNIVTANPGINFSGIREITQKGNHLLAWHLSVLEKFGFIRSSAIEGNQVYFPSEVPTEHAKLFFAMRKPGVREILQIIEKGKAASFKHIKTFFPVAQSTIFQRLKKLVEYGLIKEQFVENEEPIFVINQEHEEFVKKMLKE